MAVAEPKKFNVRSKNWDKFCDDASRYHAFTRPNDHLIIHKIETFRKYTSKEAIEYLSGYMRLHPRFETVEGWNQWLSGATQMLSFKDMAVYRVCHHVKAKNSKDVVAKYTKGKVNLRGFWRRLDKLVEDKALSGDEQRELFWLNLKEEHRKWLIMRCALFDPENVVWEKQDALAVKLAEQEVSRFMELLVVDDLLRKWPILQYVIFAMFLPPQVVMIYFIFIAGIDVYSGIVMAFGLALHSAFVAGTILRDRDSIRMLKAERVELFDPITA